MHRRHPCRDACMGQWSGVAYLDVRREVVVALLLEGLVLLVLVRCGRGMLNRLPPLPRHASLCLWLTVPLPRLNSPRLQTEDIRPHNQHEHQRRGSFLKEEGCHPMSRAQIQTTKHTIHRMHYLRVSWVDMHPPPA